MKILITGSRGFIGKRLAMALKERGHEILEYDIGVGDLNKVTKDCEFVFHFAGVNRPEDGDFSPNYTILNDVLDALERNNNKCTIMLASSIWATTDTPYGISKRRAEDILSEYGINNEVVTYAYRLCNVFGPGARYNYSSVVATWCHNLSHNTECRIDDPNREVSFVYIDDLIKALIPLVEDNNPVLPTPTKVTLQDLYYTLLDIKRSVESGYMFETTDPFISKLYSTYLYYMGYPLLGKEMQEDNRGSYTELFKSKNSGQISVEVIKPGVTKGGHYHSSKWEQFIILKGRCKIVEKNLFTDQEKTYHLDEFEHRSIYMKPMHLHTITNVGTIDAVVLIYCNQCYDPSNPDTYRG